MSKLEQYKIAVKLEAWARYKAEAEGTKTYNGLLEWKSNKYYRDLLLDKWRKLAEENKEQIISA